ncbi:MAG: hypothetical protein ABSD63_04000 [Candidatus Korobacteraceae bacterium]|jgi:putative ABC transport system permease protein
MVLRDLAIAFRVLSKSPLFTLTAVITIALGLGASTAIFSVTHDVLLRPLPYKDPDRLVIADAGPVLRPPARDDDPAGDWGRSPAIVEAAS